MDSSRPRGLDTESSQLTLPERSEYGIIIREKVALQGKRVAQVLALCQIHDPESFIRPHPRC